MSNTAVLRNVGPVDGGLERKLQTLYFPRLQVNKRGEIVLATGKRETLTEGVLVGKTEDSTSDLTIGTKFTDWEVCGELQDYDGEVTVTLKNELERDKVRR